MKARQLFSLTLSCLTLAAAPLRAQDGWVDLFNGKNLDGWSEHSGKAKYTVADGVLTGESVSGTGPPALLMSTRHSGMSWVKASTEARSVTSRWRAMAAGPIAAA